MNLVNKEIMMMCHYKLSGNKAIGVDKVIKREYGANLEANIDYLLIRMKSFKYRAKSLR